METRTDCSSETMPYDIILLKKLAFAMAAAGFVKLCEDERNKLKNWKDLKWHFGR